jgi:hypothetical protein
MTERRRYYRIIDVWAEDDPALVRMREALTLRPAEPVVPRCSRVCPRSLRGHHDGLVSLT